jgi:hypothetical protein
MIRKTATLKEDQRIFFDNILLSYSCNENYFTQNCWDNQNTRFIFNQFFSENRTVYKKIWWSQTDLSRLYAACVLHVGYLRLQTHSEYVLLIAFPLKNQLRERASMLRLYLHFLEYYYHQHHHHKISLMKLGHLLTRSGLSCPEASSKVSHGSFCQSGSSVLLPWVIY